MRLIYVSKYQQNRYLIAYNCYVDFSISGVASKWPERALKPD